MKVIKIMPLASGVTDAITVEEIEGDLESLQKEVGGLIEFAPAPDGFPFEILVDEEGLLKNKPLNAFGLVGTALLVKLDEDNAGEREIRGLTDEEIKTFFFLLDQAQKDI